MYIYGICICIPYICICVYVYIYISYLFSYIQLTYLYYYIIAYLLKSPSLTHIYLLPKRSSKKKSSELSSSSSSKPAPFVIAKSVQHFVITGYNKGSYPSLLAVGLSNNKGVVILNDGGCVCGRIRVDVQGKGGFVCSGRL
jgi:hypothetical protein